jgi:hypothetical protein
VPTIRRRPDHSGGRHKNSKLRTLELLRPLANSILLAANPDLSLHPVMEEINRALSAFSPKQAAGKGRTTEKVAD